MTEQGTSQVRERRTAGEPPSRRRRRNRLLLAGLLPSLVALLVAASLLLTLHRNHTGLAAYDEQEFGAARSSFAANRWFGSVEPWVAPFNEGDAHFYLGEYESAVEDFRAALLVVPLEYECRVRLNLALARERIGDAAPDPTSARAERAWRDARDALAAGDCTQRTDVVEGLEGLEGADDLDAAGDLDPEDADRADELEAGETDEADEGADGTSETEPAADGLEALLDDLLAGLTGRPPADPAQTAVAEESVRTDERLAAKLAEALAGRDRREREQLTEEERKRLEQLERAQQRAQETEAKDPPPASGNGDSEREDYRW